jgi:hypothetical protein
VNFWLVLSANFMFVDIAFLRPSFWVLMMTLAIALASLVAKWLRPREPTRVRLRPAE